MRYTTRRLAGYPIACVLFAGIFVGARWAPPEKEYLTAKEIEQIQDNQEIDKRTKIYLDAAALRLKTAEERLNGKEAETGDPMEFFSVEEMLDGYYKILNSVMVNLDSAAQNSGIDPAMVHKALKDLKSSTERGTKDLAVLKKIAEDQKKEELWNLVNQSIEITNGAHEGATAALAKAPPSEKPKKSLKKGN